MKTWWQRSALVLWVTFPFVLALDLYEFYRMGVRKGRWEQHLHDEDLIHEHHECLDPVAGGFLE